MYICMCLKVSVNQGQPVIVFVFCCKIEWFHMVLRIQNLERKKSKLHEWLKSNNNFNHFLKKNQKLKIQACGVFIQRQQIAILSCTLRFSFGQAYLKLDSKEHFQKQDYLYRFLGPESVFLESYFRIRVCSEIFQCIASG